MTDINEIFWAKIPEMFKISKDDEFRQAPTFWIGTEIMSATYASAPVNGINVRVIYNSTFKNRWSCRIQEEGIVGDPYVGQDNDLELAAKRLLARIEQGDGADSKYLAVFNWKFLAINRSQA